MANNFFSDLYEKESSSPFFSDLDAEESSENKPSFADKVRKKVRGYKTVGAEIAGIPGDLASNIGQGLNWIAGKVPFGKPKTEEELRSLTDNPFTSQNIKKKIEEVAPYTAPRTNEEKEWEEDLGLVASLAIPLPGGKAKVLNPLMKKDLYRKAINLGLTEKDLAPLFHGKMTEKVLAKLAGKGKEAANNLSMTRESLSNVYDTIKAKGAASGHIPDEVASKLGDELFRFRNSLEKTLSPSPEKLSVIKFIDKAENNLMNHGATAEELINFYQDINRTVNWSSIHGGKKILSEAKVFIKSALHKADPSLARDFGTVNELYAKNQSVIKALGSERIRQFVDAGAGAAILGAAVTGNFSLAEKLALGYGAKKGLGKIAGKLLTDPKWQNLHGKILNAIKNKSLKSSQVLYEVLRERVKKELPETYEEIEWPD